MFSFDMYYPSGGWGDCDGSFDTVDEARDYLKTEECEFNYCYIIDLETGEEIDLIN